MRVWLAAALLLGIVAVPAFATTASDLCPAAADPCVVEGSHDVDDFSVIDVGDRELRVVGSLDVGLGSMTLRARRIVVAGSVEALGDKNHRGGTIVLDAGSVAIEGAVDAIGARGGTIDLSADGEVVVFGTIRADALRSEGSGGSIALAATTIRLMALVSAVGGQDAFGGSVAMRAGANLDLSGTLDVSGGDGGQVELEAGMAPAGGLMISVGARILSDATCKGCSGGVIRAAAGGVQNPGAMLEVDGELSAVGSDGDRSLGGGDGGTIDLVASGDLRLGPFAALRVSGGGPDGFGGDVTVSSGGSSRFGGSIDVGAHGTEGVGGTITIAAAGATEVSGVLAARAELAGDVEIQSGGLSLAITAGARIDAAANIGGEGGTITLNSFNALAVDGLVRSDGGVAVGAAGGRNELGACRLEIGPTGEVRSRGRGGANVLRGRNDTIIGGTLLADENAGFNEVRFALGFHTPVFLEGAIVIPEANQIADSSLVPCSPDRATPTARPTSTATSTASPVSAACPGDCNRDGVVTVNEVVLGTSIGLELQPLAACPAMDRNGDDRIEVAELVTAVLAGLSSCPAG